jgi:protein-tyrosine phosphatase
VVPGEIRFAALFNVRDLGGHRTADGRRIRQQRLIRGASLHRIAGQDVETLRALGVRTVLDLRTGVELREAGAFPGDALGIEVRHLPLIPDLWAAGHVLPDASSANSFMTARYVDMIETAGPAIVGGLQALADDRALPAVVFCTAGKDRTGVFVSILLDLLGVREEAIVADYECSREGVRRLDAWLAEEERRRGAPLLDRHPPELQAAPREAILGFLAELRRRHGSTRAFVAAHGADAELLSAVEGNLLETG